uniref:FecR family protein n=1 Tax=uncultured Sphingomonas sp. TaxID=158754 RepID=UPI0035CA49D3
MAAEDAYIIDRAIDWHLRQADMSDTDWHAFVTWLEADPAHARVFDTVALDMAVLGERADLFPAVETPAIVPPVVRTQPRRVWAWVGGGAAIAVAASLTLIVAPLSRGDGGARYTIETKPGQRQDIALNDGTRIELNGASRLRLDHQNPRIATLEAGEATFHVRHDPQDPFTVHSGGLVVQDVGTVFNVERDGARLDVQVAEGSVLFQPRREAVTLRAGAAVSVREDLGRIALSKIDVTKVGAWRSGAVALEGAPFGRIATIVKRFDGVDLSIDASLSQRPFTGMVRLSGAAVRDVPHLAALVGAEWHHDGERWFISPR